jgi:hypothetical protein
VWGWKHSNSRAYSRRVRNKMHVFNGHS